MDKKQYQYDGVRWILNNELREDPVCGIRGGIIADEMGLGKTLMTISLLAHHACENGNWGPHLIVVPTSVMLNWEIEIKKFIIPETRHISLQAKFTRPKSKKSRR